MDFEVQTTGDASPTLAVSYPDGTSEWMHSSKGALSETLHVYRPVIQQALMQQDNIQGLSLGLGLGYVELTLGAELLQAFSPEARPCVKLDSFEKEEWLRRTWLSWLAGKPTPTKHEQCLFQAFTKALTAVSDFFEVSPEALKKFVHAQWYKGRWQLWKDFKHLPRNKKYNLICYDAFSSETTPELWREEKLRAWLSMASARPCFLATYAATGALKRALRAADFEVQLLPGFAGKRHCTRALRKPVPPAQGRDSM